MNSVLKGLIIIIVAPSGAGKTTLIKRIKANFPQIEESVSFTTRPRREGEEDGVNYFFINTEEFKERLNKGEFLEWAVVHSNYYGTSKKWVEGKLKVGSVLLFDLDVQGADSLKKNFSQQAHAIFIGPPSISELEKRLIKRGTDSPNVIRERVNNARKEIQRKNDYDYSIINIDLDTSDRELSGIISKIIKLKNS